MQWIKLNIRPYIYVKTSLGTFVPFSTHWTTFGPHLERFRLTIIHNNSVINKRTCWMDGGVSEQLMTEMTVQYRSLHCGFQFNTRFEIYQRPRILLWLTVCTSNENWELHIRILHYWCHFCEYRSWDTFITIHRQLLNSLHIFLWNYVRNNNSVKSINNIHIANIKCKPIDWV